MARTSARLPTPRTPREWALRGGAAAAALLLGYTSTKQTLGFAFHKSHAERAYTLAPGDGRVASEFAEQISTSDAGDAAQRAHAVRLSHQALMDEPLAVPALTVLALNAQLAGDITLARALSVHSNSLSRRELGTRLLLIEDAVTRNDVVGALRHYDIGLRTSLGAPKLLFPVLSQAISDPSIAAALANTLASRPPWAEEFLRYIGDTGTTPALSARFFQRLAEQGVSVPETAQISVVNALATAGLYEDGWHYYRSLRSGADPRRSRDPDFAAQLQVPSVFDWTPIINDGGVNASIDGGIFDFAAPSTVGGAVLQQIQILPPGRYRLQGLSAGIDQARGSGPYWQVACIGGGELGRVEVPNSAENGGRFTGTVTVGSDCKVQALRLVLRPSAEIRGVSGQIDRVMLTPVGPGK